MGVEASVEAETSFQDLSYADRNRGIVRMNNVVKRRLQSGVDFNMKVLLRGDRDTGKSNLLRRLQGMSFQHEHIITPEITVGTLNWQNSHPVKEVEEEHDEIVKVDVWDIVDRAPIFEYPRKDSKDSSTQHKLGPLDASSIDVYRDAQAAIFMVNPFSKDSFDYVESQLPLTPPHIIILIALNFFDLIEKDRSRVKVKLSDILHLIDQHKEVPSSQDSGMKRRNIYAMEVSLLTGYGLDIITQFLYLPFYRIQQDSLMTKHRILQQQFERHEQRLVQLTLASPPTSSIRITAASDPLPSQQPLSNSPSSSSSRVSDVGTAQSSHTIKEPETKEVEQQEIVIKSEVASSSPESSGGKKHVQWSSHPVGHQGSSSDSDQGSHTIRPRVRRTREGQRRGSHSDREFSPLSTNALHAIGSSAKDDHDNRSKATSNEPPSQPVKPGLKRVKRRDDKELRSPSGAAGEKVKQLPGHEPDAGPQQSSEAVVSQNLHTPFTQAVQGGDVGGDQDLSVPLDDVARHPETSAEAGVDSAGNPGAVNQQQLTSALSPAVTVPSPALDDGIVPEQGDPDRPSETLMTVSVGSHESVGMVDDGVSDSAAQPLLARTEDESTSYEGIAKEGPEGSTDAPSQEERVVIEGEINREEPEDSVLPMTSGKGGKPPSHEEISKDESEGAALPVSADQEITVLPSSADDVSKGESDSSPSKEVIGEENGSTSHHDTSAEQTTGSTIGGKASADQVAAGMEHGGAAESNNSDGGGGDRLAVEMNPDSASEDVSGSKMDEAASSQSYAYILIPAEVLISASEEGVFRIGVRQCIAALYKEDIAICCIAVDAMHDEGCGLLRSMCEEHAVRCVTVQPCADLGLSLKQSPCGAIAFIRPLPQSIQASLDAILSEYEGNDGSKADQEGDNADELAVNAEKVVENDEKNEETGLNSSEANHHGDSSSKALADDDSDEESGSASMEFHRKKEKLTTSNDFSGDVDLGTIDDDFFKDDDE